MKHASYLTQEPSPSTFLLLVFIVFKIGQSLSDLREGFSWQQWPSLEALTMGLNWAEEAGLH